MQADNTSLELSLHIAGMVCATWDELSVDSDIGVPADAFSFSWFGADGDLLPAYIVAGAPCQVRCNGALVLTGVLDRVSQTVGRSGFTTNLSGRDLAGQLLDCSAPIDAAANLSLSEIIQRYVVGGDLARLPIRLGRVQNDWLKAKTGVDIGESIWDVLTAAAQASGQYVWLSADGALMIGNPFDVPQPPTMPKLYLCTDDRNPYNNVLSADFKHDISNDFSSIQIVGQNAKGKNFKATATDHRLPLARHRIMSDSRSDTQAEAERFAAKAMSDAKLDAIDLTLTMSGWTFKGLPWATGWKVSFDSNVMPRAAGDWVIYGRTMQLSRDNEMTTELRLKRPEDWMQPIKFADLIKK